jgi:hypothetical protein
MDPKARRRRNAGLIQLAMFPFLWLAVTFVAALISIVTGGVLLIAGDFVLDNWRWMLALAVFVLGTVMALAER